MPAIVADMIRAGTNGTHGDGRPKVNGIGFMSVIGDSLVRSHVIAMKEV
jgi:hypothetical protein